MGAVEQAREALRDARNFSSDGRAHAEQASEAVVYLANKISAAGDVYGTEYALVLSQLSSMCGQLAAHFAGVSEKIDADMAMLRPGG